MPKKPRRSKRAPGPSRGHTFTEPLELKRPIEQFDIGLAKSGGQAIQPTDVTEADRRFFAKFWPIPGRRP